MELYQALITLDGWTFLAQICNLMIQLVIFKKFLLKPIKQVIADRKAKADSEIADAQKLRTEAENTGMKLNGTALQMWNSNHNLGAVEW